VPEVIGEEEDKSSSKRGVHAGKSGERRRSLPVGQLSSTAYWKRVKVKLLGEDLTSELRAEGRKRKDPDGKKKVGAVSGHCI